MSSGGGRQYVSSSPSYPGVMDGASTWEESYRQRARMMTRDYVNPNSTRLNYRNHSERSRRSRSADVRPQYRSGKSRREAPKFPEIRASSSELSNHRAQCLNMFYPTTDETRARVTYDTMGPQFLSQLPKPVGIYEPDFERSRRPMSQQAYRQTSSTDWNRSHGPRIPPGMVDPYENSAIRISAHAPTSSYSNATAATSKRQQQQIQYQNKDYVKNSLIMFGDEESSMSTGLSQQELLQKKRKEQTTERRKAKNQQRKRIVNLPTSLFSPHSSRQQSQQKSLSDDHYDGTNWDRQSPPTLQQYEPPSPHLGSRGLPARTKSQPQSDPQAPDLPKYTNATKSTGAQGYDTKNISCRVVSPDPPDEHRSSTPKSTQEQKGWRGSMVNRMRNQKSSTGRRWKIIPSLSRSRSRSQSPVREENNNVKGPFPSPARQPSSSWDHDQRYKQKTKPSLQEEEKLVEQDPAETPKSDPPYRRPLDPPSQVPPRHDYSSDEEQQEPQNSSNDEFFQEPLPSGRDMGRTSFGGNEPKGAPLSGSEGEAVSPDFSMYAKNTYRQNRGLITPQPRDGSEFLKGGKAKYTPRESTNDGAFPDFTTPTTPLTTSVTSFSSSDELPSDYDANTTILNYDTGEDSASFQPYLQNDDLSTPETWGGSFQTLRSMELSTQPSKDIEKFALNDFVYRDDNISNVRAAYAPSSRLNNPPGLDMDYFAPQKPDAPGTFDQEEPQQVTLKISPTSATDFPNPNVHWSDELHQLPTPRRISTEKPKSILRSGRIRPDQVSGGKTVFPPGQISSTQSKAIRNSERGASQAKVVRISELPTSRGQRIAERPNDMGFVDNEGHELSPINSFDVDEGSLPAHKSRSPFERSMPKEFQSANWAENVISETDDHSEESFTAYTEFIESVACVVLQTAVRKLLAKRELQQLREKRDSMQKIPRQRRMQEAVAAGKRQIQSDISSRRFLETNLDIFYIAATRIQSAFRGWYARDCMAVDNYCAAILQRAFRTYCRRKQSVAVTRSITRLQALVRRKRAYEIYATSMYCIVAIQAAFRGHIVRKMMMSKVGQREPPLAIQHVAATVIQSQWRCFRCEMAFLRAYEDILLVQSVARGWVARRIIRSWLRTSQIQASISAEKSPAPVQKYRPSNSYSYTLPQGYHNHTTFMKQSLPSPVRSTQETTREKDGVETSKPVTGHAMQSIKGDGLVEMYQRQRGLDRAKQGEERLRSTESDTQEEERALSTHRQRHNLFPDNIEKSWGKASATPKIAAKESAGRVQTRNDPKPEQANTAGSAMYSIGSWKAKQPQTVNKTLSEPFEHDILANGNHSNEQSLGQGPTASTDCGKLGVKARMAAFENPQRKVSKTLSRDEFLRERESGEGSSQASKASALIAKNSIYGKPFQGSGRARKRLEGSSSFDAVHNKHLTSDSEPLLENSADMTPAFEASSDITAEKRSADSSKTAGAFSVLASWRDREKKSSTSEKGAEGDDTVGYRPVPSRGTVKRPSWLREEDETANGAVQGEDSVVNSGPGSWQVNLRKIGKSHSDGNNLYGYDSQDARSGKQSSDTLFGRKLHPMNQGLDDEKKDDSTLPFSTKVVVMPTNLKAQTANGGVEQSQGVVACPANSTVGSSLQEDVEPVKSDVKTLHEPIREGHQLTPVRHDGPKKSLWRPNRVTAVGPNVKSQEEPIRESNHVSAGHPLHSKSALHVEMRRKRSDNENQRIDRMHHMFMRAGLMGRHEKEKISFANTTSAEYEERRTESEIQNGGSGEPTASDVLHAWRDIDQSQPMSRGKLF